MTKTIQTLGRIVVPVFFLFVLCGQGESNVMLRMNVESLTHYSDIVVVGQVVDVKNLIIAGQPWTAATILVEQAVKGSVHGYVYFRIPGGYQKINGRTLVTRAEGAPELNSMQRAVIFLQGIGPGYSTLSGWSQGYWRIRAEAGKEYASASSEEKATSLPLDELLRNVHFFAERERAGN